jgi:hypothetical protein
VVDLLVLVHRLVDLRLVLKTCARPEQVPLVQICLLDAMGRQDMLQDLAL